MLCARELVRVGILLAVQLHVVIAQRLINVDAVLTQQPVNGYLDGGFRYPLVIQIQRTDSGQLYACPLNVTASLILDSTWDSVAVKPTAGGTLTGITTTGTVTFDNVTFSKAGAGFYLRLSISAVVENTTLTWNTYTSAFMVGGYRDGSVKVSGTPLFRITTPAPPTTREPTIRPATPSPTSNVVNTIQINLLDVPSSVTACSTWSPQPKITLTNTSTDEAIQLPLSASAWIVAPAGVTASLRGQTAISGTGTALYTNLSVCSAGFGFHLAVNVTVSGTTRTIYSDAFDVAGTVPTTVAPPTATAVPAATFDLSRAVVVLTQQPSGAYAGAALGRQPICRLQNSATGAIIPAAATAVASLYIPTGLSSTAKLLGTTTVTAVSGVMTFTNLAISEAGYGFYIMITISSQGYTFVKYTGAVYISKASSAMVNADGDLVLAPNTTVIPDESNNTSLAPETAHASGGLHFNGGQGAILATATLLSASVTALLTFLATRRYYGRGLASAGSGVQLVPTGRGRPSAPFGDFKKQATASSWYEDTTAEEPSGTGESEEFHAQPNGGLHSSHQSAAVLGRYGLPR